MRMGIQNDTFRDHDTVTNDEPSTEIQSHTYPHDHTIANPAFTGSKFSIDDDPSSQRAVFAQVHPSRMANHDAALHYSPPTHRT